MSSWKSLPAPMSTVVARNGRIVLDGAFAKSVHGFGFNPDVSTASVPETLWTVGGVYVFTVTPATLSVVSTSAADTAAGTGARTVRLEGLNSAFYEISETVTMNGTTLVNTTQVFARINRAFNVTAGSGGVNAGAITISDGVNTVCSIVATYGQSQMAIFTVPMDYSKAFLCSTNTNVVRGGGTTTSTEILVQTRERNAPWRNRDVLTGGVVSNGNPPHAIYQELIPGSDFRMTIVTCSTNSTGNTGTFEMLLLKE